MTPAETDGLPYSITLTADERRTIDWFSARYGTGIKGRDLGRILRRRAANYQAWTSAGPEPCTLRLAEWEAWQIRDEGEADGFTWPGMAEGLFNKMQDFCDRIV